MTELCSNVTAPAKIYYTTSGSVITKALHTQGIAHAPQGVVRPVQGVVRPIQGAVRPIQGLVRPIQGIRPIHGVRPVGIRPVHGVLTAGQGVNINTHGMINPTHCVVSASQVINSPQGLLHVTRQGTLQPGQHQQTIVTQGGIVGGGIVKSGIAQGGIVPCGVARAGLQDGLPRGGIIQGGITQSSIAQGSMMQTGGAIQGPLQCLPVQDTPQPQEPVSEPTIDIVISNVVCSFSTRCHLNLKEIAMNGSNVIYKRENGVSWTS